MPKLLRVDRGAVTTWHGFGWLQGRVLEYVCAPTIRPAHPSALIAQDRAAAFRAAQDSAIEWLEPEDPRLARG